MLYTPAKSPFTIIIRLVLSKNHFAALSSITQLICSFGLISLVRDVVRGVVRGVVRYVVVVVHNDDDNKSSLNVSYAICTHVSPFHAIITLKLFTRSKRYLCYQ